MNTRLIRILSLTLLTASLVATDTAFAAPDESVNAAFTEALEYSLKEKKGVMVYVNGQAIAGRVTKLNAETVELSSREFARIVVRRERIDAVAGY